MNMKEPIVVTTAGPRLEELLTVQEFASRTRVHPMSVYRLIAQKKQPGVVRVGRHIRINASIALQNLRTEK